MNTRFQYNFFIHRCSQHLNYIMKLEQKKLCANEALLTVISELRVLFLRNANLMRLKLWVY